MELWAKCSLLLGCKHTFQGKWWRSSLRSCSSVFTGQGMVRTASGLEVYLTSWNTPFPCLPERALWLGQVAPSTVRSSCSCRLVAQASGGSLQVCKSHHPVELHCYPFSSARAIPPFLLCGGCQEARGHFCLSVKGFTGEEAPRIFLARVVRKFLPSAGEHTFGCAWTNNFLIRQIHWNVTG